MTGADLHASEIASALTDHGLDLGGCEPALIADCLVHLAEPALSEHAGFDADSLRRTIESHVEERLASFVGLGTAARVLLAVVRAIDVCRRLAAAHRRYPGAVPSSAQTRQDRALARTLADCSEDLQQNFIGRALSRRRPDAEEPAGGAARSQVDAAAILVAAAERLAGGDLDPGLAAVLADSGATGGQAALSLWLASFVVDDPGFRANTLPAAGPGITDIGGSADELLGHIASEATRIETAFAAALAGSDPPPEQAVRRTAALAAERKRQVRDAMHTEAAGAAAAHELPPRLLMPLADRLAVAEIPMLARADLLWEIAREAAGPRQQATDLEPALGQALDAGEAEAALATLQAATARAAREGAGGRTDHDAVAAEVLGLLGRFEEAARVLHGKLTRQRLQREEQPRLAIRLAATLRRWASASGRADAARVAIETARMAHKAAEAARDDDPAIAGAGALELIRALSMGAERLEDEALLAEATGVLRATIGRLNKAGATVVVTEMRLALSEAELTLGFKAANLKLRRSGLSRFLLVEEDLARHSPLEIASLPIGATPVRQLTEGGDPDRRAKARALYEGVLARLPAGSCRPRRARIHLALALIDLAEAGTTASTGGRARAEQALAAAEALVTPLVDPALHTAITLARAEAEAGVAAGAEGTAAVATALQAVAAYRRVLRHASRPSQPAEWQAAQIGLGQSLARLWQVDPARADLPAQVSAHYELALAGPARLPPAEEVALRREAAELLAQAGQRRKDRAMLGQALALLERAEASTDRKAQPAVWLQLAYRLAHTRSQIAEMSRDPELIGQAIGALEKVAASAETRDQPAISRSIRARIARLRARGSADSATADDDD